MKKNSKKTAFLLTMLISFASLIPSVTYAASNDSNDKKLIESSKKIEEEFENINVQTVSNQDIDTSNALVVNSEEEYYQLLQNFSDLNNDKSITNIDPSEFLLDEQSNSSLLRASYVNGGSYTSKTASKWVGRVPGAPPVKINMCFNFKTKKSGKTWQFKEISKKKSWISGIQVPIAYKWKQLSLTHNLNKAKTKASFTVKGTLGMTVIYNNLPKIMTTSHTYKFDYNISNAKE